MHHQHHPSPSFGVPSQQLPGNVVGVQPSAIATPPALHHHHPPPPQQQIPSGMSASPAMLQQQQQQPDLRNQMMAAQQQQHHHQQMALASQQNPQQQQQQQQSQAQQQQQQEQHEQTRFTLLERTLEQFQENARYLGLIAADFQTRHQDSLNQRIHTLVSGLQELQQQRAQFTDVGVPLELLDYLDHGKNPQLYTKELLERTQQKNRQANGKIEAYAKLRALLLREWGQEQPADALVYRDAREQPREEGGIAATDKKEPGDGGEEDEDDQMMGGAGGGGGGGGGGHHGPARGGAGRQENNEDDDEEEDDDEDDDDDRNMKVSDDRSVADLSDESLGVIVRSMEKCERLKKKNRRASITSTSQQASRAPSSQPYDDPLRPDTHDWTLNGKKLYDMEKFAED